LGEISEHPKRLFDAILFILLLASPQFPISVAIGSQEKQTDQRGFLVAIINVKINGIYN
jgi:hypothetical protein